MESICNLEFCERKAYGKLPHCYAHYLQFRKHGQRTDINDFYIEGEYAFVTLYKSCKDHGEVTVLDIDDWENLKRYRWISGGNVYAATRMNGGYKQMHNFLMTAPKGMFVDHINGNSLDNRRINLRVVTEAHNVFNRKDVLNNPTRGTYKTSDSGKWAARIGVNHKIINLGVYETREEAIQARRRAELIHYGNIESMSPAQIIPKPFIWKKTALT